ncbi:MAG: E2 ligase fold family C protein, partial [Chloroflexota bacterium]|nr:E2 ligase fold family C protein [Chloroflexota bacterium]
MAVPDYFRRNAIAAAQAISGLDEERLAEQLGGVRVGVTLGRDAADAEGAALTDLLIRLLARLYPTLSITGESGDAVGQARNLAARINPAIEFVDQPTIEVVVGTSELPAQAKRVFVGSSAWSAVISTRGVQRCGSSLVPFGAGAAACLAAANVFRYVFLPEPALDDEATLEVVPPGADG